MCINNTGCRTNGNVALCTYIDICYMESLCSGCLNVFFLNLVSLSKRMVMRLFLKAHELGSYEMRGRGWSRPGLAQETRDLSLAGFIPSWANPNRTRLLTRGGTSSPTSAPGLPSGGTRVSRFNPPALAVGYPVHFLARVLSVSQQGAHPLSGWRGGGHQLSFWVPSACKIRTPPAHWQGGGHQFSGRGPISFPTGGHQPPVSGLLAYRPALSASH